MTDLTDIANTFNDFFANIGHELASKIHNTNSSNSKLSKCNCKSIFLLPVSVYEMEIIIYNLKDKKGGIDHIHSKILKVLSPHINQILVNIFSMCIKSGIWPDALKYAEVVPVYKAGDSTIENNYHSISLISNIAKLLEKIVHIRLYKFLIKYKKINEKQYGYLRDKSTVNALERLLDITYKGIDRNNAVVATFIDLSKAFDTVNLAILLQKLNKNGIRGIALELIESYLSDRKQFVKI